MDEYNILQTSDKEKYLAENGWHFNKKACDAAIKALKRKNPATGKLEKIEPWSKDQVEELLSKNNITLEKLVGYDHVYAANLIKSDNYRGSVPDDAHVAMAIREMVDDSDAADGEIMACWYVKSLKRHQPVDWASFL